MFAILEEGDIKKVEDVRLNKGGIIIGQIVMIQGKLFYLSRRTDEHFFRKYQGFGVDAALLFNLIKRTFPALAHSDIRGIIIEYQGKKEHRFYYASLDDWFLSDIRVQHSKERDGCAETYGIQKVLPTRNMIVLAYARDDHAITGWARYVKK